MGEIGYVRIHRTVWEAYVVSKCGKGAISRTATEVWASITHQRLGGGAVRRCLLEVEVLDERGISE